MPVWLNIILLLLLGFILMLIEILIIPGIGFAGFLGFAALAAGCIIAFQSLSPAAGIFTALGSIALIIAMLKLLPRTSFWKHIRLNAAQDRSQGYESSDPELKKLLNKTGVSLTVLRPAGTALIDNHRYDVTTDGDFIDKDSPITVTKVEGNKITVRAIKQNQ